MLLATRCPSCTTAEESRLVAEDRSTYSLYCINQGTNGFNCIQLQPTMGLLKCLHCCRQPAMRPRSSYTGRSPRWMGASHRLGDAQMYRALLAIQGPHLPQQKHPPGRGDPASSRLCPLTMQLPQKELLAVEPSQCKAQKVLLHARETR